MTFDSSVLLNGLVVVSMLGGVIAYYKRSASANWRDVAEQRMAAITDRDRQLTDQNAKMDAMRTELNTMTATVSRLEGEIAELKRHDLTAVIHMIERLATATEQVRANNAEREHENAALFSDLRRHVFPMIEDIHKRMS